jgi:PAS domain S-box-containing protein
MKQNLPPAPGTTSVQAVELSTDEMAELFLQFASAERHVMWVIDVLPRERVHYVSPAFETLWGISAESLYADSRLWLASIHPDDRQAVTTAFDGWVESPLTQLFDIEYRLVRPDGSERWVHSLGHPPHASNGPMRRCTGITEDITERKNTEQALVESQRQLKAVVDNMTEGLILTSPNWVMNEWNPSALALHELDNALAQGMSLLEATAFFEVCTVDGEALPLECWPIPRVLAGETLKQEEFRLRRSDIAWERVMSYSGTRVDDAEGRPQFALLQCSDVTERRRTEEEVTRLNSELERRVIERTAELQAAVKEIEAFSYSVSHDLRAPLRALDGFSQVLLEEHGKLLPDEGRRYLGIIRSTAQKMGRLIDDLLAFSRLGRQALTRRRVNSQQLVTSVRDSLAAQCQGRQIEWRLGALPDCDADLALLRQVWVNLIGNAIKYTGHCPQAIIEVGSRDADGVTEYFVRDNGAGFDMQYAHKLFGVFERLHKVEEFEGTGVGLAIVQRIVQRHGGRVRAEGEVGRGATFSFTLS